MQKPTSSAMALTSLESGLVALATTPKYSPSKRTASICNSSATTIAGILPPMAKDAPYKLLMLPTPNSLPGVLPPAGVRAQQSMEHPVEAKRIPVTQMEMESSIRVTCCLSSRRVNTKTQFQVTRTFPKAIGTGMATSQPPTWSGSSTMEIIPTVNRRSPLPLLINPSNDFP